MEVLNLGKAILVVGFPLHKPYPYSLHRFSDSSILGTERNVWYTVGGVGGGHFKKEHESFLKS